MDLRAFKIRDVAVFDVVVTLLLAGLLFAGIEWYAPDPARSRVSLAVLLVIWVFVTGFFAHVLFQVPTKWGFWVGLSKDPRP